MLHRKSHDRGVATPAAPYCLTLLGLLVLFGCFGCGDDSRAQISETGRPARDQRLRDAQVAFERGQPGVARTLMEQASDVDPVDRAILEARLALAEGSPVNCLGALARAKQEWPNDGRIFATEAEVYAVMQRMTGAEASLKEGLDKAGECAELCRARAVMALSIPGGGEVALSYLQRAFKLDPDLPYAGEASAQAHLLVGRLRIGQSKAGQALEHALLAQQWDSLGQDYRDLEAEALAGLGRYGEALEIYAELDREGYPTGNKRASLHQHAATACLVANDRAGAVSHYLAARAQGMSDEELGFGANVLEEESDAATNRGMTHYEALELQESQSSFERALELNPGNLSARNHLGVVQFHLGDHERAARSWQIVLKEAAEQDLSLPEPVHLNLARAHYASGEVEAARRDCDHYLRSEPEGVWIAETQAFLVELESQELSAGR